MRSAVADVLLRWSQPEQRMAVIPPVVDVGGLGDDERAFVDAAAAMQVGNAKAALARLEASTGPVADSMRIAATALDRNWCPGDIGAILTDDAQQWAREPPAPVGDPTIDALIVAFGRVAAMTRSWRSIATSLGRFRKAERFETDVAPVVEQLRTAVDAAGLDMLAQHLALVLADLHRRADTGQAEAWWAEALGRAKELDDASATGRCHLVRGDWSCAPRSSPELLGFDLEAPGSDSSSSDPAAAGVHYARAAEGCPGDGREAAALALRMAFLARLSGDDEARVGHLIRAGDLARASGDAAFAQLVAVHTELASIGAGRIEADGAAAIIHWAAGPGSTSYAQGLTRLCLAQAAAWRAGDEPVAARRALRLASELGATVDPAIISRELTEQHRQHFPLAAVVVALGELDRALAGTPQPAPSLLEWMSLADRAMTVHAAAVDRHSPEAIAAGARRMRDVLGRAPTITGGGAALGPKSDVDMATTTRVALETTIADAAVLVSLYSATAARIAGRSDEATRCSAEAEAAARARGPGGRLMLAVVLGTAGRDRGHPDRRCADRRRCARRRPRRRALPAPREPRAGSAARRDGAGGAWLGRAEPACGARRQGWGSANRDRARVGGHRRVRATGVAVRTRQPEERGDRRCCRGRHVPHGGAHAARRRRRRRSAFVRHLGSLSIARPHGPRCAARGRQSDHRGCATERRGALGAWRRSESRWAATFEGLAERVGAPPAASDVAMVEELTAAEVELDDAESELERAAPGVLAARREPPPMLDPAAVAATLPDDGVLLQYHAFGDDLIVWALTGTSLTVGRRTVGWREVTAMARRFLDDASGTGATFDASTLSALLLDPVAGAIGEHRRLIVVPYGGLAAVPFQLLPFEGGILADGKVVSYLPAASLASSRSGTGTPRLDVGAVVVGNPAYAPGRGMRPLPGAGTEAHAVASVLSGSVELLVGAKATEAAVSAAVGNRPILHLATHGLLSERSPNRSAVALAGDDELTVGDLVGLDLDTDLVVLSACDTGRGTTTLGGDVIGLVRAVLAAGARNVVVSQWPVDDRAGCVLMASFYERLAAGDDVAKALAAAAAMVRALDGPALAESYETLRQAAGTSTAEPARRDLPGSPVPRGDHASRWAPFIHIGV